MSSREAFFIFLSRLRRLRIVRYRRESTFLSSCFVKRSIVKAENKVLDKRERVRKKKRKIDDEHGV